MYFFYPIIKQIKNIEENDTCPNENIRVSMSIIYILIGIISLKYGGDFVVDSSINIARILNIREDIIGLTIIAFGTSLPELVTSIIAVIKGDENLAVGNIIGSCIFNLLLILAVGAIITPLNISMQVIINLSIIIASTLLIWGFSYIGRKNYITRIEGFELLGIFCLYIINLFIL